MKKLIILMLSINMLFAEVVELVSGVGVSDSVLQGDMKVYKIHGDAGQSVESIMSGLSDDGDLYVKIGSAPTTTTFDCRSIHTATRSEECTVDVVNAGDVYIGVYGYKATDYEIKATAGAVNNDVVTLTSGTSINGEVVQGETQYYKLAASNGETVESLLSELNADADLYVKIGSKPTSASYDCKSTNGGTNEDGCSVVLESDSEVFIGVYGYRATSYKIKATKDVVADEVTVLTSEVGMNGSVEQGKTKYYKIAAQEGETVSSLMDELSADADIYVKVGSKPTGVSFDCKSTNGGSNSDGCSVVLEADAEVFIGIFGYRAANYQITASIKAANDDGILLSSGEAEAGSVLRDAMDYYRISVANKQTVSIILDELNADADLYVQIGSKPTSESYACHSTKGGNSAEECRFSINDAAEVYIGVFGFRSSDFRITATVSNTPAGTNMLEDAEGGDISPNWVTLKGNYVAKYYARPNLATAPAGTGIIAFDLDSSAGQLEYYTSYMLPINDSIHKILEIDLGGLPTRNDAYFAVRNINRPGVIIHYGMGVEVETLLGTRRMNWDSFFNHRGVGPHFGTGNWLDYPSPVEMTRGGARIGLWNHFKVDLEQQLKLLEPNNRIVKVNYFFTLGGAMDNIKLTSE